MNETDDFASPVGDDADSVWLDDLFERTRSPGTAAEMSVEADVVGAMARTITQPRVVADISAQRRRDISKTAARAAIVGAALLVGTSTAAATGNLPDAAQSAVARASSHLGLDIPDPSDHRADEHHRSTATTERSTTAAAASTAPTMPEHPSTIAVPVSEVQPATAPSTASSNPTAASVPESTHSSDGQRPVPPATAERGPDVTGPAKQGLCRAWAAHDSESPAAEHSTAMKNLQDAAAAAGQTVDEFCAPSVEPESTEVAATPAGATPGTAVDDQGKKDKHQEVDGVKKDQADKEKVEKDKADKEDKEKKEKEPKNGG